MLTVLLFYFFLLALWLEIVLGFKLTQVTGLSLHNIAFYLLFLAWAIKVIRKKKIFEPNRVNKYILLLFAVVCVSIPVKFLLNEVPDISLFKEIVSLKGWVDPILLFLILYNTINDEKSSRWVMAGLIVFLVVTMISAIGISTGLFQLGRLKVVHGGRSEGFVEPNQYAAYLVLFFPVLFSGALFADTKKKQILFVLLIFIAFVSLLITGSRGGAISFVFATCVYLFIFSRSGLIRPGVLILSLAVVVSILGASTFILAPKNIQDLVVERFDPAKAKSADEYTSGRLTLWSEGIKLFYKSPIFGHGQATFIPLMKKNFHIWGNSHNDYLLYLVQYGVIGLGLFLMVLWSLFRESWAVAKSAANQRIRCLILSYIVGFAGYALAMFGVNVIQPRFLFWAYSAVVLRYGRLYLQGEMSAEVSLA